MATNTDTQKQTPVGTDTETGHAHTQTFRAGDVREMNLNTHLLFSKISEKSNLYWLIDVTFITS